MQNTFPASLLVQVTVCLLKPQCQVAFPCQLSLIWNGQFRYHSFNLWHNFEGIPVSRRCVSFMPKIIKLSIILPLNNNMHLIFFLMNILDSYDLYAVIYLM